MPRVKKKVPKKNIVSDFSSPVPDKAISKRLSRGPPKPQDVRFPLQISASERPYRLGCITLNLQDGSHSVTPDVFVHFEPESINCSLHWKQVDENMKIQEKSCTATYETPYDILHNLFALNIFNFVISSEILYPGDIEVHVCINTAAFVSLAYASEPFSYRYKEKVFNVLKFFLGIEFEEYEDGYLVDEEQVPKIYSSICNCYNPEINVSISHDYLIPDLRSYQSQAVHWMLKQEREDSVNEQDLHVLYSTVTLQDGSVIYLNKYGGFFVGERYSPEKPCKGGILADEMGLGKTIEVLACVLLHPRDESEKKCKELSFSTELLPRIVSTVSLRNSKQQKKRKFSDFEDEESCSQERFEEFEESMSSDEQHFECVCGSMNGIFSYKRPIKCHKCGIVQHAECVLYLPDAPSNEYLCPYCWIKKTDHVISPATLIVSPSTIIYQWNEEITRHIKKNSLKVFMYKGVEHQKFVDPSFLANHDIVLTSYETFRRELNHVDVPYGDARHVLRHRKKFGSLPSPLSAIQWWRICLDEAQMVESVLSKTSKMALKLHSINRWCVTGTPIQKSVEDLYGLLLFLGMNPYQEKFWWKDVLWKPFVNGNTSNMVSVLKQIAWRTPKKKVWNQIGLPELKEVLYMLDFSPIERVFYERQHSLCRNDFVEKMEQFDCLDVKLSSMDRRILSKVLHPLKRLQQTCCHFQISYSNFIDVQKNKMTTGELLARLLKTTKYECEEFHRKFIMSLNGAAGLYVIQKDFENAIKTYEKVLKSIEDNKCNIRTDVTQLIHSSFHLSNILSESVVNKSGEVVQSKFVPSELNEKVKELSDTYLEKLKSVVQDGVKDVSDVSKEISEIMNKFKLKSSEFPTSAWWCEILQSMTDEMMQSFLEKLDNVLKDAPGQMHLRMENSMIDSLQRSSFLATMFEKSEDLHATRLKLRRIMESISVEPTAYVIDSVISCHLRPADKATKCVYCKAEDIFKSYEAKLFRFDENVKKSKKDDEDGKDDSICFQDLRRGTHADSDLEIALKYILNCSRRHKALSECTEDGTNELKLMDTLKKEFKVLRALWLKCNEYISQKDEIEMAKICTRLLHPGEVNPNPPVPYIISQYEVQPKLVQYLSDTISFQFELKKKMGQLFYLQNLEKADKEGPFDESCPICRQKFGKSWSVIQCGHSFCLVCIQRLLGSVTKFANSLGFNCEGIRCPVCRELTACTDVYCIDNDKKAEENDVTIKGSYSAKVTAVVKCLLNISKSEPGAKSLIFSSFTDFLFILERALVENDIKCLNVCRKMHFQDRMENFKQDSCVSTLLIPLSYGCNGLNITEANHVLLLEPVLDYSKHLQAIGRVHRIGQTKKATVHKFIISKTIDENIHAINKNSSSSEIHVKSELTLRDLKHIFE